MGLPAGHRLGPYEVVAPLGAGGMGEVYRARDVRSTAPWRSRSCPRSWPWTSSTASASSARPAPPRPSATPHIAHVYDVGEQDGTHFIAMEYVEGENLRQLVSRGPPRRGPDRRPRGRRWPPPSRRPTRGASSTATSSPRTPS